MGPPKVPQTVYFKRFGTFERVLGVEGGGGRPAGWRGRLAGWRGHTHARTHGRTPAWRPTLLHNYHLFEGNILKFLTCGIKQK